MECSSRSVDVVVPVYGAPGPVQRCLQTLVRHTDLQRNRLLVVLDGPADPEVERALESVTACGVRLVVLRNPKRIGFVGSVNRALRDSEDDAVLLNSDTQVTGRWLEKLSVAAVSSPDIATVTPFSNHATICSLPRFLEENTVPAGYDVDSFAALVERCSRREYPELPTGVGVCLYLRRAVLDEIGLLDERSFGLGYGEESELCMRATRAGYRHVLDDATFIYHEGQRSFGTQRRRRVVRAHRLMRRRHPEYLRAVARFIRKDPLRALRERVVAELRPPLGPRRVAGLERVVHVVHGWPPWNYAGTELYARWLATEQAEDREVAVYSRMGDTDRELGDAIEHLDQGVRVRLTVNNFLQRNPISRNGLHSRVLLADFRQFLDQVRPDLVHFHQLSGHSVSLALPVVRRRIPMVVQLQDWWPLCARVNLFHRDEHLCSGPAPVKCSRCLPLTGQPPGRLWNPLLYRLRETVMKRFLASASALVMGSRAIEESYRHLGFLPERVPSQVIPYGVGMKRLRPPDAASRPDRRPLVFGVIGSLLPHKGVHDAVEAFRVIPPAEAVLEVWGDPAADPAYFERLRRGAAPAGVRFNGRFGEEEKERILSSLDVLVVPSRGLESFGLVAREAFLAGTPVLASRRGALTEIYGAEEELGYFEAGNPADLARRVRALIDDPERLARWRRRLPAVKGIGEHAREIDAVYEEVLHRAPRGP